MHAGLAMFFNDFSHEMLKNSGRLGYEASAKVVKDVGDLYVTFYVLEDALFTKICYVLFFRLVVYCHWLRR